jgi:hypothetical protein
VGKPKRELLQIKIEDFAANVSTSPGDRPCIQKKLAAEYPAASFVDAFVFSLST